MTDFNFELPVFYKNTHPVFLFSFHGSGIMFFRRLLRKYLLINFDTGMGEFMDVFKKFPVTEISGEIGAEIPVEYLKNLSAIQKWKLKTRQLNPVELAAEENGSSYLQLVKELFQRMSLSAGTKKWGYATSNICSEMEKLAGIFPDGYFIHLLRDGREIAARLSHNNHRPQKVEETAIQWKNYLRQSRKVTEKIPAGRLLEVDYEYLLSHPDWVFFNLMQYLSVEDPGNQLSRFISNNIFKDVKQFQKKSFDRHLTPDENARFDKIAGDFLRQYGFEKNHPRRRAEEAPYSLPQF